jgi:hypothetical protein
MSNVESERLSPPKTEAEPAAPEEQPRVIHPIQRLMDNPWLLLVLSLMITAISYTGWAWWEIATIAPATLP